MARWKEAAAIYAGALALTSYAIDTYMGPARNDWEEVGTPSQPVIVFNYRRNEGLEDGLREASQACKNGIQQVETTPHFITRNQATVICNIQPPETLGKKRAESK